MACDETLGNNIANYAMGTYKNESISFGAEFAFPKVTKEEWQFLLALPII